MICIDNSEWMRNGDYAPSRFQAQADAVNLICGAKTQVKLIIDTYSSYPIHFFFVLYDLLCFFLVSGRISKINLVLLFLASDRMTYAIIIRLFFFIIQLMYRRYSFSDLYEHF